MFSGVRWVGKGMAVVFLGSSFEVGGLALHAEAAKEGRSFRLIEIFKGSAQVLRRFDARQFCHFDACGEDGHSVK